MLLRQDNAACTYRPDVRPLGSMAPKEPDALALASDAHAYPNLLTTYEAVHQSDLDSEPVGFTSDPPVSTSDFDILHCAWPQFPTAQRRLPGTSFILLPSNTTRSEVTGKAQRPSSYHTRTMAFSPPSSVPRDFPHRPSNVVSSDKLNNAKPGRSLPGGSFASFCRFRPRVSSPWSSRCVHSRSATPL